MCKIIFYIGFNIYICTIFIKRNFQHTKTKNMLVYLKSNSNSILNILLSECKDITFTTDIEIATTVMIQSNHIKLFDKQFISSLKSKNVVLIFTLDLYQVYQFEDYCDGEDIRLEDNVLDITEQIHWYSNFGVKQSNIHFLVNDAVDDENSLSEINFLNKNKQDVLSFLQSL